MPSKESKSILSQKNLREDSLLMQSSSEWMDLITCVPITIAAVADLMISVSQAEDVSLVRIQPEGGFKVLSTPGSLKASLVQMSMLCYDAFNEANSNMSAIQTNCQLIISYVEILSQMIVAPTKSSDFVQDIKDALTMLSDCAESSESLANSIDKKFESVLDFSSELVTCLTALQSSNQEDMHRLGVSKQVNEERKKREEARVVQQRKQYDEFVKGYEELHNNFNKVLNSAPSGFEIFLTKIFASCSNKASVIKTKVSNARKKIRNIKRKLWGDNNHEKDQEMEYDPSDAAYDEALNIDSLIEMLNLIVNPDDTSKELNSTLMDENLPMTIVKLEDLLRSLQGNTVGAQQAHNLCSRAIEIAKEIREQGRSINPNISGTDIRERLTALKSHSAIFVQLANKNTDICVDLVDLETNDSDGQDETEPDGADQPKASAISQRWHNQLEQSSTALEQAVQDIHESSQNTLKALNSITEVVGDLKKNEIQLDLAERSNKVMIIGIMAISNAKEQWTKMSSFFSTILNAVRVTINCQIKFYSDLVEKGSQKPAYSRIALSSILTTTLQICCTAYTSADISGLYWKLSEQYLMNTLHKFNRLIGLPSEDRLEAAKQRGEILNMCTDAQRFLIDATINQSNERTSMINNRIVVIKNAILANPSEGNEQKTKAIKAAGEFYAEVRKAPYVSDTDMEDYALLQ